VRVVLPKARAPWLGHVSFCESLPPDGFGHLGWRLEVSMWFGSIVLARAALAFGLVGILVMGFLLAVTWRQVPEIHESLRSSLREARDRRRILKSFRRCQIVGRYGYTPRIAKTADSPIGRRYLLSLPTGLHFAELDTRVGELAADLRARDVRFVALPQSAGYVELVVIRRESFSREPIVSPLCRGWRYSLWIRYLSASSKTDKHSRCNSSSTTCSLVVSLVRANQSFYRPS